MAAARRGNAPTAVAPIAAIALAGGKADVATTDMGAAAAIDPWWARTRTPSGLIEAARKYRPRGSSS